MEAPILITGCARSGTSMTAGIINACGAFGGRMVGGTRNNPKGFYENKEIRETLIKPYLVLNGADPLGQDPLPDPRKLFQLANLRSKMESIFKFQGYKDGAWFYKGAKMCLIWPTLNAAFPDAQWVIVRRSDEDIINSCMKTGFMKAYKDEAGWQSWVDHHKARFEEMKSQCASVQEVWPTKFVEGDTTEIQEVVENLGLTWNDEVVRNFVSPKLWSKKNG